MQRVEDAVLYRGLNDEDYVLKQLRQQEEEGRQLVVVNCC